MKPITVVASVVLLVTSSGCAAWTVKSETVARADFARYQTYQWNTPPSASADLLADQRIRDQVGAQLAARGIQPAAPGQRPDFLVDYRVLTGARVQTIVNNVVPYAPGASVPTVYPPFPASATYTYQDQALVLDFIDARSGRVFWRGYASYVLEKPAAASTTKTQQAVGKILRKYPGTQLASTSRPSG
jgi:uncharacterized protein DUF4136